jgi:hypothetical protein
MDGGGEIGHRELGVGSKAGVGEIDNNDLRHRDSDKGICFLTMAGTAGTGSKQDRDSAARRKVQEMGRQQWRERAWRNRGVETTRETSQRMRGQC